MNSIKKTIRSPFNREFVKDFINNPLSIPKKSGMEFYSWLVCTIYVFIIPVASVFHYFRIFQNYLNPYEDFIFVFGILFSATIIHKMFADPLLEKMAEEIRSYSTASPRVRRNDDFFMLMIFVTDMLIFVGLMIGFIELLPSFVDGVLLRAFLTLLWVLLLAAFKIPQKIAIALFSITHSLKSKLTS